MCLCSFYSFFNLSFSNLVHQDKLNENRYCFPGIKQFFFFFVKVLKYKMFFDLTSILLQTTMAHMVTHTRNLCSAFNPSTVHTHSSEHTNTMNTHPEQWAAIYVAAPGEQFGGLGAFLKGTSVVKLRVERECCTFTPPAYNSCRSEIRTRNLSITNPTH